LKKQKLFPVVVSSRGCVAAIARLSLPGSVGNLFTVRSFTPQQGVYLFEIIKKHVFGTEGARVTARERRWRPGQ
jgi:hypothetical protein